MNLRNEILREHSKAQCNKIASWVGSSQSKFDQLFDLVLNGDELIVQRSCWPLGQAVINHPSLMNNHYPSLLKKLVEPGVHNAVRRNFLGFLSEIEIPEPVHGELMNYCFDFLNDPAEFVAVKANAMSVLGNLAKIYPDIKAELKTSIESQLENATPAFLARAKQVLKKSGRAEKLKS